MLIAIAIGVLAGGAGVSWIDTGVIAQSGTAEAMSAEEVFANVSPLVVTVLNDQESQRDDSGRFVTTGTGTGFVIDSGGYIVTNWHVVEGGQQFKVVFADGEARPAELVGADQLSDLAVMWVGGDLPGILPFGDSDSLRPGQSVLAIGSPLGSYTNTVTGGIISATGRDFPGSDVYTNLIQHDAPINQGNSGGPLFNLRGEVVGVNTLKTVTDLSGGAVEGISFAIPALTVQYIANQLIQYGNVLYPYIAIGFDNITPELAAQYDLPVPYGAYVSEVGAGSEADIAGVLPGDIITSIGNTPIDAQAAFTEVLNYHAPGEVVEIGVVRGDEELVLTITLEERPVDD